MLAQCANCKRRGKAGRLRFRWWNRLRESPPRPSLPAHRDMQLKAQRIQDGQNGCEIWMLWTTTGKSAIEGLPCNPAFIRDVGDVVVADSSADGLANLSDVRTLKGAIDGIGRVAAA